MSTHPVIGVVGGRKNRFKPYGELRHRCIVQGIAVASIAAASILAKQYRDQLMQGAAEQFPHYGWDKNKKGYPTQAHRNAIKSYGITHHHRRSFLTQKTELLTIPLGSIHYKMKTTALHEIHVAKGAKMVDFAGYHMPMVYTSVKEEHHWVRKEVGLFDVSHMGLFRISGEQASQELQEVFSNDVNALSIGKAQYTLLLNEKGGIVDDLLLYRMAAKEYLAVVNAANISKDWNHIMASKGKKAKWENLSDNWSILALQGPRSQEVMHRILEKSTSSLSNQMTAARLPFPMEHLICGPNGIHRRNWM